MEERRRKEKDRNVGLIRNNTTQILVAKFIRFGTDPQPIHASGILYFNFNEFWMRSLEES